MRFSKDNCRGMNMQEVIDDANNVIVYKKVSRNDTVGCNVILLDHDGKLILGTRTDYPVDVLKKFMDNGHELKWTNAGGGLESGESPIYCIMRELHEEFGIIAGKQTTHLTTIGYNDTYYLKNRWVNFRRDFIFITRLKYYTTIKDLIPQKGEIGEIKSFTKNEVIDMIVADKIHKSTKNSVLMAIKLGYL